MDFEQRLIEVYENLGGTDKLDELVLPDPIIKIDTDREFYNYDAKYLDEDTIFTFPKFTKKVQEHINRTCLKAFNALGCEVWGRVDFFMDDDHNINLIEINSIPGMTSHSLVPMSAKKAGLSYNELIILILGN